MSGNEALDESTVTEEETDFEAAFNEHAEAKEAIEEDPVDIAEEESDDLNIEAQDGEPGDDESGKNDEAEAEALSLTGMSDEDKAIYKDLPAPAKERMLAMRAENKDLNHRIDSDAGRVSAFQRKVNGLEKQIQGIRQGDTAGDQPDKAQIADAMSGTDEEWELFRKDYPEVAKAIDSRLDKAGQATQETLDTTLAPVKEMQQREQQKAIDDTKQESTDTVSETYPKWTEAVQKPEFALWLDTQPPGVQSLTESDDPQDASALIGLYDNHLVAEGQPTLKADPNNDGVDKDELTDQEVKANSVAARRKQQLEDGTTIPSKNSRVDPSAEPEGDFEAAFAFHAKRKDRQRQRA